MKVRNYSFIYLALICLSVVSCTQESATVAVEKEPDSAIELMERESGTKYFKETLVLKDVSQNNVVTLIVASKNKKRLSQYLQWHELTITPVFEIGKSNENKVSPDVKENGDGKSLSGSESPPSQESWVITEAISEQLENKAIGYRLHVNLKKEALSEINKSARVSDFPDPFYITAEHISSKFPEQVDITVENRIPGVGGTPVANNIGVERYAKEHWYNGWDYRGSFQLFSNPSSPQSYSYNIDGPWKWKYLISHFPVPNPCTWCNPATVPGYSIQFLQL